MLPTSRPVQPTELWWWRNVWVLGHNTGLQPTAAGVIMSHRGCSAAVGRRALRRRRALWDGLKKTFLRDAGRIYHELRPFAVCDLSQHARLTRVARSLTHFAQLVRPGPCPFLAAR